MKKMINTTQILIALKGFQGFNFENQEKQPCIFKMKLPPPKYTQNFIRFVAAEVAMNQVVTRQKIRIAASQDGTGEPRFSHEGP